MKKVGYVFAGLVLGVLLVPWLVQAAPARLPPPPVTAQPSTTPTPDTTPTAPIPTTQPSQSSGPSFLEMGAWLELHLAFAEDWHWEQRPWHALYTTLEWQDAQGRWHSVGGWQGGLDTVSVPEVITVDTPVVGLKTWWAPKLLLGQGPFRWLVYAELDGTVLVRSTPFYLPEQTGQRLSIEVVLEP